MLQPYYSCAIFPKSLINRPTGYIASQRVTLNTQISNGDLSVRLNPMRLAPPNLKISVRRIAGSALSNSAAPTLKIGTNEGKAYVIGNDGLALTTDNSVELRTEWVDADGRSLPTGLIGKDHGYTGRIAVLRGNQTLEPAGSASGAQTAHFAIEPGSHLQILQLPDQLESRDTFYVQIDGRPLSRTTDLPQFDELGASVGAEGALAQRPTDYVPLLTPVADERADISEANNRADLGLLPADLTGEQSARYRWVYRPEFSFSVKQLDIQAINREYTDKTDPNSSNNPNGPQTTIQELLALAADGRIPTIRSDDTAVSILYNLLGNNYTPLDGVNGESPLTNDNALTFSLGGAETEATIGNDSTVRFNSLEHLDRIGSYEFLTA